MSTVHYIPSYGRFVAYYNEKGRVWEVRVVDQNGKFSRFAGEAQTYLSYTDARERIELLEETGAGVFDLNGPVN